jgi:hypothetical protein
MRNFSNVVNVMNGFSFPINEANVDAAHQIGKMLSNQQLIDLFAAVLSKYSQSKPFIYRELGK